MKSRIPSYNRGKKKKGFSLTGGRESERIATFGGKTCRERGFLSPKKEKGGGEALKGRREGKKRTKKKSFLHLRRKGEGRPSTKEQRKSQALFHL